MLWDGACEVGFITNFITVSHNSENTIRRTIESVYEQKYLQIKYIIVDGSVSTDHTMEIVEEYKEAFEKKGMICRYILAPDAGIYDAMNKGIRMSQGEIIGIINSDDWYEPEAAECAAQIYERQAYDLFYSALRIVSDKGSFIKKSKDSSWVMSRYWNHPTTFIPKCVYEKYQYKNETLHDNWDLILRIRKGIPGCRVCVDDKVLANFTRNGYSRLYFIECYGMEAAKLVV